VVSQGPLTGLVIIDLSCGVGGGYCTKLLADYGADVVKVEQPGTGDPVRHEGPFADASDRLETGALHLYLNTNKKSLTLDVETPTGQQLLERLLENADALVVDGEPGRLDALGLGEAVRRERFPRLVTTLVSAYGQDGPWADAPATHLTAFAAGGQMAVTGDPDREPLKNGGYQADYQAGLNAFAATLAGLWAAGDSGIGDDIDISAMECMASTLELMLNTYCYLQVDNWTGRRGNIMSSVVGLYPCADGYLGVHAMPRNWPALVHLMESEWMLEDERFRESAARLQNDDELRAFVYAWASDKEKKEVYARAGTVRAPVAYVHDMADLLESPHLAERDYFHEIDHPVAGKLTYPGAPIVMSETPWQPGRAPLVGEHTDEVLTGLGLTPEDIKVLAGQGII
jgi:crotonobetainyl-CoA:carnitine CoA-transferase CaiB-like acyl-CoA transferase